MSLNLRIPQKCFYGIILFLIAFLLPQITFAANTEEVCITKELLIDEPSCFVNNSVNVITGHYHDSAVDMEVAGPHPLFYQRSYSSGHPKGNLFLGWTSNHTGYAEVPQHDPSSLYLTDNQAKPKVIGNYGAELQYDGYNHKSKKVLSTFKLEESSLQKYITNCGDQHFSPGKHVRNNQLLFSKKDLKIATVTGDGYKRLYQKNDRGFCEETHIKSRFLAMDLEEQPNNLVVSYANDKISLRNRQETELSYIYKKYTDIKSLNHPDELLSTIVGSDGKWVKYHYLKDPKDKRSKWHSLHLVEGSDIPTTSYAYSTLNINHSPKIIQKNLPEGRFLNIQYFTAGEFGSYEEPRVGRVKCQLAPVGFDNTPIVTHGYVYNLYTIDDEYGKKNVKGGYTSVYDSYLNRTDYHFNDDFRITEIVKWGEAAANIHTIEHSRWGQNDTPNSTNLVSRSLANGQNEIKLCRSYAYDPNGNTTVRLLWGNLTGRNPSNIILDANGYPIPGCSEWVAKTYAYYTGNPNLLAIECDGKKTIEYHYIPQTNLNTIRFTKVDHAIRKREFKTYDINSCLSSVTVDNGFSANEHDYTLVTERKITTIQNRITAPIGLPEIIEQKYMDFDTNRQVLLGKVVNVHSPKGKLVAQAHYDSENTFRFLLEWNYDDMGNLIYEKDAIGRVITRKYDLNKNLIYEEGPIPGVTKEYRYDFVNRLIGTTESHPDGVKHVHSYRYDYLGNKIASIDPYGHETTYVYDNQNRLIKTIYPPVLNENMVPMQPTTSIEYDLFDNPCKLTDASGGVITIFYTVYNKPYFKNYPDGTAEAFEYDIYGRLIKSTGRNGTTIYYQYDFFDRLLKKDVYSINHEFIHSESNVYDTFHLLSKMDPTGATTFYHYDKAGRLASTTKGDMRTEFQYDTLGREKAVLTFYGKEKNAYTADVKEYDFLNRLTEKRLEDPQGNILTRETYGYDLAGHQNLITKYNQAGTANTSTEYNTRGEPILVTTATGEITRIHYRYDYYDPDLHQNLPYCETINPNGVVSVCIKDALGRTKTEYKKDPYGVLLQKRNYYYTAKGLLARTVDEVIIEGKAQDNITNICKYNSMDQLTEIRESDGSPKLKVIKYHYNSFGQKEAEIKPDGTALHYCYDSLGRLKEYFSSDHSFHYCYEYDANSNLRHIRDQIQGTITTREYDHYDRLVKEILCNGLSTQYEYDLAGKPTQIIFPDGSGMGLTYEHAFLKTISRLDQHGHTCYSHVYDSYDLSGNVMESTMIGKAGKISYDIDLEGRISQIVSRGWSGSIDQHDPTGNITEKTFKDGLGSYSSEFKYDALDQLIEEQGHFSEKYANDSLYNRISKGDLDYTVNALNQVTHDGISTYEYDLNGNLVWIDDGIKQVKLAYDALNRLIGVEKDEQSISYFYDPMNRRVSKKIYLMDEFGEYVLQKTFRYFYQDLNEIGCYEDGTLTQLRLLGIGKGAEIGAAVGMEIDGVVYAPLHDMQGNVVSLVEANTGKVTEFYRYSAFGEETLFDQDGESKPLNAAINPWRFSGKRTDSETGYVYFGRRYYNSHLGRWITPDPIGFEGGPNLYAYVMNNPLSHIDLYGLQAEEAHAGRSERSLLTDVKDFFVSFYEGARDCVVGVGRAIGEGLSRCSSYLSDCFSSGNDERQVAYSKESKHYCYWAGVGAYLGIIFMNGIKNGKLDFESSSEMVASLGGGQIIGVYNPSNSFYEDLCRAANSLVFNKLSSSVFELHKAWNEHFEKYGLKALLVICHSEGAINVRNALMCYNPELRKMIDVLAIAPAAYVDRDWCKSVQHYVSTRDIVPWIDVKGRMRNSETVHVLEAHENASFWDHEFQSPTYARSIKHHIELHIRENGY